jgi:hypothetical protein
MLKSPVMILSFLAMCGGARAEFALLPTSSPTSPPQVADAAAPSPKSPAHQAAKRHNRRAERHLAPDPLTARGFGSRVPLAFAVRQIVPATINVSFAPGADQDALVDWQGGKRWNIVLTEAIRPLGLELKRHQAAAVIAPAAKDP